MIDLKKITGPIPPCICLHKVPERNGRSAPLTYQEEYHPDGNKRSQKDYKPLRRESIEAYDLPFHEGGRLSPIENTSYAPHLDLHTLDPELIRVQTLTAISHLRSAEHDDTHEIQYEEYQDTFCEHCLWGLPRYCPYYDTHKHQCSLE